MSEKLKFFGGVELFKRKLSRLEGDFFDNVGNILCRFRTTSGELVNLYGNGTVQFQNASGDFEREVKKLLRQKI